MLRLRVACLLSALVCVPAHAQECSGGPGGGIDATGNQCGAPGQAVDSALSWALVARAAPATALQRTSRATTSRATPALHPAARTSAPAPTPTSVGEPVGRLPVTARPPVEPVRTAKIESGEEAFCSGGGDGGMDATGNQCNPTAVAGGVVVIAGVQGH